jgi:hypothetical protein
MSQTWPSTPTIVSSHSMFHSIISSSHQMCRCPTIRHVVPSFRRPVSFVHHPIECAVLPSVTSNSPIVLSYFWHCTIDLSRPLQARPFNVAMPRRKEEVATTQEGLMKWEKSNGKKILKKELWDPSSRYHSMRIKDIHASDERFSSYPLRNFMLGEIHAL